MRQCTAIIFMRRQLWFLGPAANLPRSLTVTVWPSSSKIKLHVKRCQKYISNQLVDASKLTKKALRDLSSFFPRIWNGLDNLPNWANCPVLGISTIFCSIILVRGFNVSLLLQWSMERTILPDNEMTHWFMNALAKNQHWINTFDAEFFFLELRPGISSVLQT